ALVDHLQHVVAPDHARRQLHAARTPAVRERHLAAPERDLVPGNGHGLEDGPADHPLGLLVEKREVVGAHAESMSARSARNSTSSEWKSTWCGSFRCWPKPAASTLSLCESTNSSSWLGAVTGSSSSRARSARSTSAIAMALRSACPKARP